MFPFGSSPRRRRRRLGEKGCRNVLIAFTPATRMVLSIVQMQFIFLNTKEFELKRHKVIVRFGLMHMLATNLCEWLYVLVEETRHEISNNIENIIENAAAGSFSLNALHFCIFFFHLFFPHFPFSIGVNLVHFAHSENAFNVTTIDDRVKRATASEIVVDCRRVNIMVGFAKRSTLQPYTSANFFFFFVILGKTVEQLIPIFVSMHHRIFAHLCGDFI